MRLNKDSGLGALPGCRATLRPARKVAVGAALLLVMLHGAALAASHVLSTSLMLLRDHTRIIFESDGELRFTLFSLQNPERALLDLSGVGVDTALEGEIDADHPYIKAVHVTSTNAKHTRIELDFKMEVDPRAIALKPSEGHGYRVVFDIYPRRSERAAPLPSNTENASRPLPVTAAATLVPDAIKPASTDVEEVWLAVGINRQAATETVLLLRRADGHLLARREDLEHWRFTLPDAAPVLHDGETYYPLDAMRGLSYQVDEARQTLLVDAAPGLFGLTEIKGSPAGFTVPTPASPGGFINYDLHVDHTQTENRVSGLFQAVAFGGFGAVSSDFVGHNLNSAEPFVRLESTWTRDQPARLASMRVGDAISRAGAWGGSVRFGGVQWASNFATQPAFNTVPLPGLAGEAVLPSTVDLYVNNALRMRDQVPAGPFSIQNLPVVTGQGEARLVVRDMLGREQIITQPFYVSPSLLQRGLHDYSYELGFVRENFGIDSNDYGHFMAAATHRLGLSDRLTGEAHGELLRSRQTLGLSGTYLWPAAGIFTASIAGSRSERGNGGLLSIGFERQSRSFSFGANSTLADKNFTQLGLQPGQLAPRQISRAFASLSAGRYGSMGLSYTHQDRRDLNELKMVNLSYSTSVGRLGFINFSLAHFLGDDSKTVIGLSFTSSFDNRTSGTASATTQAGNSQAVFQLQRNLLAGDSVGYHVTAGAGNLAPAEAGISAQNGIGTFTLAAAQSNGQTAVQGNASGGIGILGGNAFFSRRITDSFAMVQMPGYAGVRVYADNQIVARTDANGNALIPRLRAYQKNAIRIEQADLPLDIQIDTEQLVAVPYFRSGLVLPLQVRRSRGALLTVIMENGEPLPAGAIARILGKKEEFPVGQRGQLYLSGLAASNSVRLTWRGHSCDLAVSFPDTNDPLPELGTYTCTGVNQ